MEQKTKFKTNYQPSNKTTLICQEPTRTKQSCLEECDINYILKQYTETGILPTMASPPTYMDCAIIPEFQNAQNNIIEAKESFDNLTERIKRRFNYNAWEFVKFVSDDRNIEEMKELGIIETKKEIIPSKTQVTETTKEKEEIKKS